MSNGRHKPGCGYSCRRCSKACKIKIARLSSMACWRWLLCYDCYSSPLVKRQYNCVYPLTESQGIIERCKTCDPYLPTKAYPGTLEKVNVMAARRQAGVPIFHPDDNVPSARGLDYGDIGLLGVKTSAFLEELA